jgi:hypothetical protein
MARSATAQPLPLVALSAGFIALWLIAAAFPFIWTAWGSFKVEPDFFSRADWTNAITGVQTIRQTGAPFTGDGYEGAWIEQEFWRSVINTGIVTLCVVVISLTLGTLGGYALARSGYRYTFWILIAALIFRAMPHVTLVSGLSAPVLSVGDLGLSADDDHRAGGDQSAVYAVDAAQLFPVDPQGSGRERDGRWLHPVSGVSAGRDPGDVAGGCHHGAVFVPACLQRLSPSPRCC